jgi:hypothetical protein
MLGLPDCQISLGHMFEYGRGVKQDYTPAVRYYKAAAEQGHAEAQVKLQAVYEKVNREYVDAQKAVAEQQQLEHEHMQLLHAKQQRIFQHLQQQAVARSAAAAPVHSPPSVASVVAGTRGIPLGACQRNVVDLRIISPSFVTLVLFGACFQIFSLPSPLIIIILQPLFLP